MIQWKNLDTLESYKILAKEKKMVDLHAVLEGPGAAERVAGYSIPAGCGLRYNFAAKQVDDDIIDGLCSLAEEAQLKEKYIALRTFRRCCYFDNRQHFIYGTNR